MYKLKDFLIENEDFKNKILLFITFDRDKIEKIIISNNDSEHLKNYIYNFFKLLKMLYFFLFDKKECQNNDSTISFELFLQGQQPRLI